MNNVSLVGRLTADLSLKETSNGTPYVKFSLAVDKELSKERREQFEAINKATADFPRIAVYGKFAETVSKYLNKGSLISLTGAVRTDSFDGLNGEKVFMTEINASRIRFLESKKQFNVGAESEAIEIEVHDDIPF
jgi:single-strand DNA-binding protein